jgi:hypothetical protein
VWGFEFTTKAAHVLVHEVARVEELAERRRARSADHAGLEVEGHRVGNIVAALGNVVKSVCAVELRVVVAAVIAVATDPVLVPHHLLKRGAHVVTALARLHVRNFARRRNLEAGSTREKRAGRSGKKIRNSVWQFGTRNRKRRWRVRMYPGRGNKLV